MYNGESTRVTLHMDRKLLNIAIDRFGADAHMRSLEDGAIEASAEVEAGPTFYGWLFQFGAQAKLLAPPRRWRTSKTGAAPRWHSTNKDAKRRLSRGKASFFSARPPTSINLDYPADIWYL